MINFFAQACIYLGLFFTIVGTVGVFRFSDVYLRLQASSKSLTFGFSFFVFGIGLLTYDANEIAKAVLIVAFQFLTAPLAAQMIARAAVQRGIMPRRKSSENEMASPVEIQPADAPSAPTAN
ncbi:MAG: monovalent cation/H(+) antiporter subunit G [Sumerlaeia bacterium]